MKVWLVGAEGQLGKSIIAHVNEHCAVYKASLHLVCTSKNDVDICHFPSISEFVTEHSPDIIVNAAAYTDVESAENNLIRCQQVNVNGVANLTNAAKALAIPIIHISTDYVFDGNSSVPYIETDSTHALNVYGQSKCESEALVQQISDKYIILRTAWLVSSFGRNFAKTVMSLSKQHSQLSMISDQLGCPTYADDLATTICHIILAIEKGKSDWGIFHYCGDTAMSWYELTENILDEAVIQQKITSKPDVFAITSDEYSTEAIRPKYSVMNCQKIHDIWGIVTPEWKDSLKRLVQNL
ncbi:dTDP-4-dehydrorhamnose reductase [Shewanella sp. UCD-FRSSP16_17]|uniref:dTDP-4-dehydrorhamnose reductase n=1 Tax=Shewanella sp. UCD-FRSSP16_17 TaxID=1853256 RepID=UPI0007EEBD99|nr:dTDP-4-dehydrorhamnose reductase [Shewanella sp. UCD-FRSSP16_17]OBT09122.1 dTDP-4-dehydrorhamnose reductase [Shewanella sp. UCD-FRSSP16_17]